MVDEKRYPDYVPLKSRPMTGRELFEEYLPRRERLSVRRMRGDEDDGEENDGADESGGPQGGGDVLGGPAEEDRV